MDYVRELVLSLFETELFLISTGLPENSEKLELIDPILKIDEDRFGDLKKLIESRPGLHEVIWSTEKKARGDLVLEDAAEGIDSVAVDVDVRPTEEPTESTVADAGE